MAAALLLGTACAARGWARGLAGCRPARLGLATAAPRLVATLSTPAHAALGLERPAVLFEDDDALVVHKGAGRSFHADAALGDPGVLRELRQMQADGELEYRGELHSVHRLDTPTSGILVLAKSSEAQAALCREFEARRVSKYYIGLSDRAPSKKEGKVAGDMEKARRGCYKLLRSTANPALTHFASRGLPSGARAGVRLLLLKPETGKTHQLRVAMKSLGAPLLGDGRYARAADAASEDRCYLHAAAIRLRLPGRAQPIRAVCAPRSGRLFAMDGAFGEIWESVFPAELLERAGEGEGSLPAEPADGPAGGRDGEGGAPAGPWAWASARRRLRSTLQAAAAEDRCALELGSYETRV